MKIATFSKGRGFCYVHRIQYPIGKLVENDHATCVNINPSHDDYYEKLPELISQLVDWGVNVFLFQMASPPDLIIKFADINARMGFPILIVTDIDDDFTNTHPSNSHYRYGGVDEVEVDGKLIWEDGTLCENFGKLKDIEPKDLDLYKFDLVRNRVVLLKRLRALMYSDIITCTTPDLAETFSKWNSHIKVLPNYINPDDKPKGRKKDRDHVLIGWQGGDSHHHDLRMIMPALKRIKEKYGAKVKFRFMGADFRNMYKEVGGEFCGWIQPENFFHVFASDLFDIGLIPLVDPVVNPFNLGKSNVKWVEYSHYGIPSVVSSCKPYDLHIDHGNNGFLACDIDDWFNYLSLLIDDSLLRSKIGYNAKKEVESKWYIQNNYYKWLNLYKNSLAIKSK